MKPWRVGHLTRQELKELVRLLEKARVVTEVDPVFGTTGIDGKWGWNRGQPGESWLAL